MLSSLKKGGSFLLAILDTLKTLCGKVSWEELGTTEFHFKPSQPQTQEICAAVHVSRFAPKKDTGSENQKILGTNSIKDLQDDSCFSVLKPEGKVCRSALWTSFVTQEIYPTIGCTSEKILFIWGTSLGRVFWSSLACLTTFKVWLTGKNKKGFSIVAPRMCISLSSGINLYPLYQGYTRGRKCAPSHKSFLSF